MSPDTDPRVLTPRMSPGRWSARHPPPATNAVAQDTPGHARFKLIFERLPLREIADVVLDEKIDHC